MLLTPGKGKFVTVSAPATVQRCWKDTAIVGWAIGAKSRVEADAASLDNHNVLLTPWCNRQTQGEYARSGSQERQETVISRESASLIGKARTGSLSPDDVMDGTFTVTNLGAVGGGWGFGTCITCQPQSAILDTFSGAGHRSHNGYLAIPFEC